MGSWFSFPPPIKSARIYLSWEQDFIGELEWGSSLSEPPREHKTISQHASGSVGFAPTTPLAKRVPQALWEVVSLGAFGEKGGVEIF